MFFLLPWSEADFPLAVVDNRLVAHQQVATDDAVYSRQTQLFVGAVDVGKVECDGFVMFDRQGTEFKPFDVECGAFHVGAAQSGGDAFFFLKQRGVDKAGDGVGVEHASRGAGVDEKVGFLAVDFSRNHDMEAVSLDIEQLKCRFNKSARAHGAGVR